MPLAVMRGDPSSRRGIIEGGRHNVGERPNANEGIVVFGVCFAVGAASAGLTLIAAAKGSGESNGEAGLDKPEIGGDKPRKSIGLMLGKMLRTMLERSSEKRRDDEPPNRH